MISRETIFSFLRHWNVDWIHRERISTSVNRLFMDTSCVVSDKYVAQFSYSTVYGPVSISFLSCRNVLLIDIFFNVSSIDYSARERVQHIVSQESAVSNIIHVFKWRRTKFNR